MSQSRWVVQVELSVDPRYTHNMNSHSQPMGLVNLYLYTKVADKTKALEAALDEIKAAHTKSKVAYDKLVTILESDLYNAGIMYEKTKADLALTQCTFALCDDGCCGWRCRAGHGQCEEHTKDSVQQLLSGGSFNQCNYICDVTGIRCQEHITPEEVSKSMSR